ncbi:MAG: (Fe-S)-binding protein, partial [Thermoanaerobaculia bacterium]|nr:(Fe-S)-binding protein [Thermoanaerobaculia bacterium]
LVGAFREFKSIWDPDWRMNPGKVVTPYRLDENLRLGADYDPWEPKTHFQYPEDRNSFARAALRCVGVGKCRREGGGVMCPSYMVTREEKHATRGRAHLLWEMLNRDVIDKGWRDERVKEALDLCLACKGCKKDCPVDVDMATYKAEFLSHYYKGRLRPMTAYSMGLIYWWSRIASHMPDLVNFTLTAPGISSLVKRLGGIAGEREMPLYANEPFRKRFGDREPNGVGGEEIILWPDTFNNHFHPETAEAAVEVLEASGFRVTIPERILCCGRPLYDYGFLGTAKRLLREILDELRPQIRAGIPVVGLEPSCVSVFRDELTNLFPHDIDAKRLSDQTYTLSEFLRERDVEIPEMERRAIVQGHCHDKSVLDFRAEEKLLRKMGLELESPDSGCCGMAGSFGFESEKYDVSVACGERVILPEVRSAPKETLIVADGFSCREQIRQDTDRTPVHTAQVIRMAMGGAVASDGGYPERALVEERSVRMERVVPIVVAGAAVAGLAAGLVLRRLFGR